MNAVSYFSNQLRVTIEALGVSRSKFAEAANVAPATMHAYIHATGRGPDAENLEKICTAVEDLGLRAQLIIAHLRDETPASGAKLVEILSLVEGSVLREEPTYSVELPKAVKEDFRYLEEMASQHPAVVESIRSTVKILRGL